MPAPLPHAPRSQVFTALMNKLLTCAPPIGTTWGDRGQRLKHWVDVPSANQPAMFLYRGLQTASMQHAYGVTKWQWRVLVWIYFKPDGLKTATTYPDQLTDQFLDNLEQTMQTEPGAGQLTLGGLVQHCWIDGNCAADPGLEDGQAVIVVPISILI